MVFGKFAWCVGFGRRSLAREGLGIPLSCTFFAFFAPSSSSFSRVAFSVAVNSIHQSITVLSNV